MTNVKLYCANCLDVISELRFDRNVCIITDPPYPNFNTEHGKEWQYVPIDFLGDIQVKQLIFWPAIQNFPLDYTAVHIWHKPNGQSNEHYERIFERNGSKVCRVYDVPIINYSTLPEWTPHPTQKPKALMKALVERFTKLNWTIIDPFMGSGTTGVAAVQLGRDFVGVEISAEYYAIAEKRIAEAQAQLRLL